MGDKTSIAWTDHTFNPWWGCTKVSPECDNCYAEAFDKRVGGAHWGKGVPRRTFGDAHWEEPLKWDADAKRDGVIRKVFCASMADVMDKEAPEDARPRLYSMINRTENLIWQLLTKRPHYFPRFLPATGFKHRNVWLGTTCGDQHWYDVRWPELARAAAMYELTSFISYEPALGPLTIRGFDEVPDWIIFGGETGAHRRPMKRKWAEDTKAECEEFGVAFFMKQMSAHTPKGAAALIPAELLVRQFPSEVKA